MKKFIVLFVFFLSAFILTPAQAAIIQVFENPEFEFWTSSTTPLNWNEFENNTVFDGCGIVQEPSSTPECLSNECGYINATTIDDGTLCGLSQSVIDIPTNTLFIQYGVNLRRRYTSTNETIDTYLFFLNNWLGKG